MHWWLPAKASTFTGPIDGLFLAILIITGIAFVLVEVGLIWFMVQYRQRPGRKAFYTHGNTRGGDLDRDPGRHHGGAGPDQQPLLGRDQGTQ